MQAPALRASKAPFPNARASHTLHAYFCIRRFIYVDKQEVSGAFRVLLEAPDVLEK